MYRSLFIAVVLGLAVGPSQAANAWTHCFAEGEDASSRHYYFFLDSGARTERVRWVWNGGCCNPPEVTDYNMHMPGQPGAIRVRHLTGERRDILNLVTGGETPLSLDREYLLALPARSPETAKTPVTLDRQQSTDLYNLIGILSMEKPERPAGGCQPMEPAQES